MRTLSICLALLGLAALVQGLIDPDHAGALFGVVVLLCAATTFGARGISTLRPGGRACAPRRSSCRVRPAVANQQS